MTRANSTHTAQQILPHTGHRGNDHSGNAPPPPPGGECPPPRPPIPPSPHPPTPPSTSSPTAPWGERCMEGIVYADRGARTLQWWCRRRRRVATLRKSRKFRIRGWRSTVRCTWRWCSPRSCSSRSQCAAGAAAAAEACQTSGRRGNSLRRIITAVDGRAAGAARSMRKGREARATMRSAH